MVFYFAHIHRHLRWAAGFVLALAGVLTGCSQKPPQPPAAHPPEVTVGKPVLEQVTDYEEFTGHTEAVRSVTVRAMVTGYLNKVLFTEGSNVEKGQPLFQIDPKLYQADFDRAQANVTLAKAHLRRLEADLSRAKKLLPTQAISQEDFDKVAGDRDEAAATVGVAENARKLAQDNLDYTTVRADFSGRISRQMIDAGNMVKANDTALTTLVSTGKMYVYFDVDERTTLRLRRLIEAGKIAAAEHGGLTINYGLSDEDGFPHSAAVNFVDNSIDMATGTWRLRALVNKPDPLLLPNMFLRVRVPIGKPYAALLVPERALGTEQGQKYLYLVDHENKTVYRPVECGPLRHGMRAILKGLKPNDRFVVDGLQRIVRSGTLVDPKDISPKKPDAADQAARVAGMQPAERPAAETPTAENRSPVAKR